MTCATMPCNNMSVSSEDEQSWNLYLPYDYMLCNIWNVDFMSNVVVLVFVSIMELSIWQGSGRIYMEISNICSNQFP